MPIALRKRAAQAFTQKNPQGFFGKRQGVPVVPVKPHTVHLSWAQTGGNNQEAFGVMLVLKQAPTSPTDHLSLPIPTPLIRGGPRSSRSEF